MKSNPVRKLTLLALPVLLLGLFVYQKQKGPEQTAARVETQKLTTLAITQIIEHPSLDQEREGVLSALKDAGYVEGQNLKVIYQNAQGSTVTAAQIAQKLVSLQPDVIVAISTPSAQSILSARGGAQIQLVFTAVTDPIGARLVKDLQYPGQGITGVSDSLSPTSQLKFVQRLIPKLKNLGVIYNPGEANSGTSLRELQDRAPSLNIKIILATASRTSEVATAAQSLVGRVDAIYVPNDNTAVSAIESIIRVGVAQRLPVFAGDIGSVLRGAVGVAGYNRTQLGKTAGEKAIQILKKGYSQEIPIENQHPIEITINRSAAEKMGVQIPTDHSDPSSNVHWIGGAK